MPLSSTFRVSTANDILKYPFSPSYRGNNVILFLLGLDFILGIWWYIDSMGDTCKRGKGSSR